MLYYLLIANNSDQVMCHYDCKGICIFFEMRLRSCIIKCWAMFFGPWLLSDWWSVLLELLLLSNFPWVYFKLVLIVLWSLWISFFGKVTLHVKVKELYIWSYLYTPN